VTHIDPRDKPHLIHEDIVGFNFIRSGSRFVFRRHFRSGLRSHIMQVLDALDVQKEKAGVLQEGITRFPQAKPLKMLRIFRTKFRSLTEAEEELRRVKTVGSFLAPHYLARSEEFLAGFTGQDRPTFLLCGLQDYVEGASLNPWAELDDKHLACLFHRSSYPSRIKKIRDHAIVFVTKVKEMILNAGYIPDLAGSGNLILTFQGIIKLVDINNISAVDFRASIPLDDRRYPVLDKSMQALFLLEEKMRQRSPDRKEKIYRVFLDPGRLKEVRELEEVFRASQDDPGRFDETALD
jgi:hypothetical protein